MVLSLAEIMLIQRVPLIMLLIHWTVESIGYHLLHIPWATAHALHTWMMAQRSLRADQVRTLATMKAKTGSLSAQKDISVV